VPQLLGSLADCIGMEDDMPVAGGIDVCTVPGAVGAYVWAKAAGANVQSAAARMSCRIIVSIVVHR